MAIDIYAASSLDRLSAEEADLYRQINQYRAENGVAPIPISRSLSTVANRHVLDLEENIGQLTHAWSDADYDDRDSSTWPAMWEAPQRLGTAYTDDAFENGFFSSAGANADDALDGWQQSPGHNAVLLNQGIWSEREWQALGIGIYEDYATIWVGQSIDPAGQPQGNRQGFKTRANNRNNTVRGTKQDDILTALDGNDRLFGRRGNDILGGGNGNDRVAGQNGDDILFGQAGDDRLRGGNGDDILYGGPGRDRLTGNGGSDRFMLEPDGSRDIATDFNPTTDRLGISGTVSRSDVLFVDQGQNTLVRVEGIDTLTLRNVAVDQLDRAVLISL